MKYLILFTLYIISTLSFSVDITSSANWNGKSNNITKHFVEIPADFDFQFPTKEDYLFGYFIIDNNNIYVNVGLDTIHYGVKEKHTISISYDKTGTLGYEENQQLISLCIPVSTSLNARRNYGIELSYKDGKNIYTLNDTSVVTGMKSNTWNTHPLLRETYYENQQCQIYVPYGVNARIGTISDYRLDIDTTRIYINTKTTPVGEYTFHMNVDKDSPVIYHNEEAIIPIGFKLNLLSKTALTPLLSSQIVLCDDQTSIKIPNQEINPNNPKETLIRKPIDNAPFVISTAGIYQYELTNNFDKIIETVKVYDSDFKTQNPEIIATPQSCNQGGSIELVSSDDVSLKINSIFLNQELLNDTSYVQINNSLFFEGLISGDYTIKLIDELGCFYEDEVFVDNNQIDCSQAILFNPNNIASHIFFEQDGDITIINLNHQEIAHLQGPIEWNGTDDNGKVLPVGIYFVLFEDGQTKSITLVK